MGDHLLSQHWSISCLGTQTVIRQTNASDLASLLKERWKWEVAGCAGDGRTQCMDVGRCSRGCVSTWQQIYILRPSLYHTTTKTKDTFSSRNSSCITLFPKISRKCDFFSDEAVVKRNSLNQVCRKAVVRKCGKIFKSLNIPRKIKIHRSAFSTGI